MQIFNILIWWVLITIIGLVTLPLAFVVFRFLPDRGYSLTKPLGLLLVGLMSWLVGFVYFSNLTILCAIGLLAGLGYWIWVQYEDDLRLFWSQQRGYILIVELFFAAVFLLFLFFRMYNPDILGTEKFMDMAFLNALTRADSFPPYDPWLSGREFSISYYYLGYLLMAIMTKLSATPPAIGFNLSLGLLCALSGITVFGLLFNLTQRLRVAFGGWAVLYLLGNLDGFRQFLTTKTLENFNWWTPSRIVPDTINEFPFFSFLLGDMHPHMLAVPYVLIAVGFALNQLKSPELDISPNTPERLGRYALWGTIIGALGFINSWDLPTTFFIAMLAFGLQQFQHQPALDKIQWKGLAASLGLMLGVMVVPFLPFYLTFHSQAKGLEWTTQSTRLSDFLLIFGVYLFMVLTFVAARYHTWFVDMLTQPGKAVRTEKKTAMHCPQCGAVIRPGKRICGQCGFGLNALLQADDASSPLLRPAAESPEWVRSLFLFLLQPVVFWNKGKNRGKVLGVVAAALLASLAVVAWKLMAFGSAAPAPPVLLGLAVLSIFALGVLLCTRIDRPETLLVLLLVFTSAGLIFGCEVLHINDTFDPPLDRMNTVFKFYYQAWYFLGLAGVCGVAWTFTYSLRNRNLRMAWWVPMLLLMAAALVYPYAATLIKTNYFNNVATLDGSYYLKNAYAPDREGIEWLRQNIPGTPVVLEATGAEYTDFARVSTFTGLPTVLGWAGHELQWRGNYDEPGQRIPAIDTLYSSTNLDEVRALLDKYTITFVFVGTLERQKYAAPGLDKFAQMMDKVYEKPGVTIYKRK